MPPVLFRAPVAFLLPPSAIWRLPVLPPVLSGRALECSRQHRGVVGSVQGSYCRCYKALGAYWGVLGSTEVHIQRTGRFYTVLGGIRRGLRGTGRHWEHTARL